MINFLVFDDIKFPIIDLVYWLTKLEGNINSEKVIVDFTLKKQDIYKEKDLYICIHNMRKGNDIYDHTQRK